MPEKAAHTYLFDRPGLYQIRVVGDLDNCWIEHLVGLEISIITWGRYPLVTQIRGRLADQTVLYGLLDLLTDLNMVILTVERIDLDEESENSQGNQTG